MTTSGITVLLFIIGAGTTHAFLSVALDHAFIFDTCYTKGNLFKPNVPPPSLDAFLHIVEKLEDAIDNPNDVMATLLKRFSFQDHYVVNNQLKQDTNLNRYVINKILKVDHMRDLLPLPPNVLTNEEICGLFAMLSHSWNGTEHDDIRQSDPTIVKYFPAQKRYLMTTLKSKSESLGGGGGSTVRASSRATTPQMMMMYGPREHEKASQPRELGVVALQPQVTDEAVDIARVLLGIYFSATNVNANPIVDCRELYNRISPNGYEDPLAQSECNVLGLITIGEALYRDTLADAPNRGLSGTWNKEAGCLRHHHLPSYPEGSTMAQIKGALDGYILGSQLSNWNNPSSKRLVSQMLRMYYSLPQLQTPGAPSVCNRDKLNTDVMLDEGKVTSFLETFIKAQTIDNPTLLLDTQMKRVEATVKRFLQNYEDYIGQDLNSQCIANTDVDKTTTPLDVVAVLMTPTDEKARPLVSMVASRLPLQSHGSSMSLLGVGIRGFRNITTASVAACAALRADATDTEGSRDRAAVLYDLQGFLLDLHDGYKDSLSRNGTVVIFVDFSDTLQNGNAFETLIKQLRSSNPQAKFLSVGRDQKVLETFVRIPADAHVVNTDVQSFVTKTLLPAIVSSPAQLQVPTCRSKVPQNAGPLKLKMLPSREQTWELSSEYFHRSSQPQVSFTVTSGSLKVCYGGKCKPDVVAIDAFDSKSRDRQVTFNLTDPCKDYSNYRSCPSMKFVLESSRIESDQRLVGSCSKAPNKNTDCQTLMDVEFEVSFKGMQCGCGGLLCSPLVLAACVLLALFLRT